MKLISCKIDRFGGLCNFNVPLSDGLNVICKNNGFGKSTFAGFIKAMFYGLSESRARNTEENERLRYLPWDGAAASGTLIFETAGKRYRISRTFGKRPTDDTCEFLDDVTGSKLAIPSEGIGAALFGIDADGFERTLFLSERQLSGAGDNNTVSAKLAGLVGTDGDVGSLDDAKKRLEDWRKSLNRRTGGGAIGVIKEEIQALHAEQRELAALAQKNLQTKEKIEGLETRLSATNEVLDKLVAADRDIQNQTAALELTEHRKKLQTALDEANARLAALQAFFAAGLPDANLLDAYETEYSLASATLAKVPTDEVQDSALLFATDDIIGDLRKLESRNEDDRIALLSMPDPTAEIAALQTKYASIPTQEEIAAATQFASQTPKRTSKCKLLFAILAVISLIAAVLLSVLVAPACASLLVLTLVFSLLAFTKKGVPKARGEGAKYSPDAYRDFNRYYELQVLATTRGAIEERTAERSHTISDAARRYGVPYDGDRATVAAISEKRNALLLSQKMKESEEKARQDAGAKLAGIREFLQKYPTETNRPFVEIRMKLSAMKDLTARTLSAKAEIDSLPTAGETLYTPDAIAAHKSKLAQTRDDVLALTAEIASLRSAYSADQEKVTRADEIDGELRTKRQALDAAEHKLFIIEAAKAKLTAASEKITAKYLGPTETAFRAYVQSFLNAETDAKLDKAFTVQKTEYGETRSADVYSRGTRDLYTVASKFALVDALFGTAERPFMMLDDPFCAIDDKKCGEVMKALKILARDRQILYFTCSESRIPKE